LPTSREIPSLDDNQLVVIRIIVESREYSILVRHAPYERNA